MTRPEIPASSKAIEAAGEVAAAGIGYAVGGPAGGLIAAAVTPYMRDLTLQAWGEISNWRLNSAARVIDGAANELDVEPADIVRMANASAEHQELFAEALFAASHTLNDMKIEALARAVAHGLAQDAARVDHDHLVVIALAELENAHIRLLLQMAPGRRGPYKSAYKWGWPAGLGKVLAPVAMETLARHSLVESDELAQRDRDFRQLLDEARRETEGPDGQSDEAVDVGARKPPKWRCSTFGAQCAKFLTGRAELTDIASAVQPSERD